MSNFYWPLIQGFSASGLHHHKEKFSRRSHKARSLTLASAVPVNPPRTLVPPCLSSATLFTAQTIPSSLHPAVCANTTSETAHCVTGPQSNTCGNVTFLQAYIVTEVLLPLNYSLGELDFLFSLEYS